MKKAMLLSTLLFASISSHAALVTYNDFSDITGLSINGDAAQNGNEIRLTPASTSQGGSFFTTTAVNLLNDSSFAAVFSFRIANNGGGGDGDGTGADGLAFVVQTNNSNVGSVGGGLGYEGITNSVAVEFDTYNNGNPIDGSNGNHVGIGINGNVTTSGNVNFTPRFNDGNIWDVSVSYNGITDLLNVAWSSATASPTGGTLTQTVDLAGVLGSSNAFFGFTAGTGSFFSTHDILSASFSNSSEISVNAPATFGIFLSALGLFAMRRRSLR